MTTPAQASGEGATGDRRLSLADLIARLETATGEDRYLDANCAVVFDPTRQLIDKISGETSERGYVYDPIIGAFPVSCYTREIDAAKRLIPDGLYWMVGFGKRSENEPLGGAATFKPQQDDPFTLGEHSEPAIALCIAALKARETLAKAEGHGSPDTTSQSDGR